MPTKGDLKDTARIYMEEDLRQRDQRRFFQRFKSLKIEDTRKVSLQYIRDEEGMMLRDPGLVLGR